MNVYDISGNNVSFYNKPVDKILLKELYHNTASPKGDLQGICTDGEYIYAVEYNRSTIYKYDILAGTVTSKTYSDSVCGHGNDATYNPNTGYLYIATCNDNGGQGIAVFTRDLDFVETIIVYNSSGVNQRIAGIAYNRENNTYTCCWSDDYYIFDSDFRLIREFTVDHAHSYTYAGIEVDGSYIFRLLWDDNSSPNANYLAQYDYEGNLIKVSTVDSTLESESLAYDWNGNWYAGINVAGAVGFYLDYALVKQYAETNTVSMMIKIS